MPRGDSDAQAAKRRRHGTRSASKTAGLAASANLAATARPSSSRAKGGAAAPAPAAPKVGRKRKATAEGEGKPAEEKEDRSKWTAEQDAALHTLVDTHSAKEWKKIAEMIKDAPSKDGFVPDATQCLHRWSKVLRPGLKKGKWTEEEDKIMLDMVTTAGGIAHVKWAQIAAACTGRLGKQCRERWLNHLDPTILKTSWGLDEDELLFEKHTEMGNQWTKLSEFFPGRTENGVKNRFHSAHFRKWCGEKGYKVKIEIRKGGPPKKTPEPTK